MSTIRILAMGLALLTAGCESTYYSVWEKLGVEKRDIMTKRVEKARDSQQEAQEQFRSALEQFKATVSFDGGELESAYRKLNSEFEDSEEAAETVRERISDIESVADALFAEWEDEIDLYTNANLKRDSQAKLNDTRRQYAQLLKTMRRAEARLDPALDAMRDQVLYLKHNLNARAIQSIRGEVVSINREVDKLISAMEAAIKEADRFISQLQAG